MECVSCDHRPANVLHRRRTIKHGFLLLSTVRKPIPRYYHITQAASQRRRTITRPIQPTGMHSVMSSRLCRTALQQPRRWDAGDLNDKGCKLWRAFKAHSFHSKAHSDECMQTGRYMQGKWRKWNRHCGHPREMGVILIPVSFNHKTSLSNGWVEWLLICLCRVG